MMGAISGILSGYLLALLAVSVVSIADTSLPEQRIQQIVASADMDGSFDWRAHPGQDYFTECAMVTMELLRPKSAQQNSVDSLFAHDDRNHPCENLKYLLVGGAPPGFAMGEPSSYVQYPFGVRHLAGFLFNFLNFQHLRALYWILSYLSLASIAVAAFLSQSRPHAIVAGVICLSMLTAGALHSYGYNIAHAPGFFLGFFALAVFVGLPRVFSLRRYQWAFFAALGVTVSYFDLFNGLIPTILGLTITFDRLFYSTDKTLFSGLLRAGGIAAVFVGGYVIITLPRLLVLVNVYGRDANRYISALMTRAGDVDNNHVINYGEIAGRLWESRYVLAPGGAAGYLIILGSCAWIAAVGRAQRISDTAILLLCALGCVSWLMIFPNHAYVHPWMDIRLLSVPIALGFGALTNQIVGDRGITTWRPS